MTGALSDRERAEFDRLGVTLGGCGCAGDAGGGCANDASGALDALPEKQVGEVWDWALMRKFTAFWPSTMAAPHAFPWLGDLVTRDRAWRWASQFPNFFATVDASDTDVILRFIGRTLTEVEPPSDLEAAGGKGCCKKKEPEPEGPELCTEFRDRCRNTCHQRTNKPPRSMDCNVGMCCCEDDADICGGGRQVIGPSSEDDMSMDLS